MSKLVLQKFITEVIKTTKSSKVAACCLIISIDGKILAVSRRNDPTMWGTPGGKVDDGESPIEAASRELFEETGLVSYKLREFFSDDDDKGFRTITFLCEVDDKSKINTDESGVIRWVKPSVLVSDETSPFAPYNKKLFSKLINKFAIQPCACCGAEAWCNIDCEFCNTWNELENILF